MKGYQCDVMFQLAHHFTLNIFIKIPARDFNADFFFEDTHAGKLYTICRGESGSGVGHVGKRLIMSMQRTKNICCFYGAGIYCYGFCVLAMCVKIHAHFGGK